MRTKTKKSGPYNRNFELHLTEHAIHPTWRSRKPDLEEIRATVGTPRPSLSPSSFSDGAFESFQDRNDQAEDEDDVLANVIPTILGPSQTNHYYARNTVFSNLEPITDDTITAPKPDIYYGAYPEQLARPVRKELSSHIIPSTMVDKPMAPNFFLEAKGPDGNIAVAARQARYDGAIGSRAMHSLQNYCNEEPEYDDKLYTFSSIYHGGQLQLYAHHVTAGTKALPPEYHSVQVDTWGMTGNVDTFRRGASALRNARDLAREYRNNFIQAANARVTQGLTAVENPDTVTATDYEDSPNEPAPSTHRYAIQNQETVDDSATFPPHVLKDDDRSQNASRVSVTPDLDPPASFAESFVSACSHQDQSKRQPSPCSSTQPAEASESRSHRTAAADLALLELWVETYWHEGKLCFRDA